MSFLTRTSRPWPLLAVLRALTNGLQDSQRVGDRILSKAKSGVIHGAD